MFHHAYRVSYFKRKLVSDSNECLEIRTPFPWTPRFIKVITKFKLHEKGATKQKIDRDSERYYLKSQTYCSGTFEISNMRMQFEHIV